MHRKLTITIDDPIYRGLHAVVGRGNISNFIEKIIAPYVLRSKLASEYKKMARDKKREKEAKEWTENLMSDHHD